MIADKPRWLPITDAAQAEALTLNGKYRDYRPYFELHGQQLWVRIDDQWRAFLATAGKKVGE